MMNKPAGKTGEQFMKTTLKTLVCTALVAGAVLAQGSFGPFDSVSAPDPATLVANRVARLTALLSLSTAQATQASTIFTSEQTAITPLRTTLSGFQTSMAAAVKTNAVSTINQLAAQIGTTQGQIVAAQNLADAAFYATLTTDQQTKLGLTGGIGGEFAGGHGGPGGPGSRN
jgi:hypothetical protein